MGAKSLFGKVGLSGDKMKTISPLHSHIHASSAFTSVVSAGALASSGYLYIQITPGALEVHLKEISIYTTGSLATLTVLEAPTHTTGDVAISAVSLNRKRVGVSLATLFSNPTTISGGTTLKTFRIGSGGNQVGGSGGSQVEFVFNPGTVYILQFQNNAVGTEVLDLEINWYEED